MSTLTTLCQLKWSSLKTRKILNPSEKFNVYSHLIGGFMAIIGMFALLLHSLSTPSRFFISLIYSLCVIFVFFASAIWHSQKENEYQISWLSRIDQIAIFCMIAGTYTPIAHIFLSGSLASITITLQWVFAAFGIIFKIFIGSVKRWITTVIYLTMGWITMIPFPQFLTSMPIWALFLLITGGVSFTIGAFLFMTMKFKYFHEIFHVLIIFGAILHYFIIFGSI